MSRAPVRREGGRTRRPVEVRAANGRTATAARRDRRRRQAQVAFRCECSDDRCAELIRLSLDHYVRDRAESDYLVAPGHQVDEARIVRIRDACWLYRNEAA